MSDARDTNHDGHVSLMEKVKGALHHNKNTTDTTTGYNNNSITSSRTHHTHGTAPVATGAAVPIIGQQPVAFMPMAATTAAAPLATTDPRDLNRDGYVSTSEKLQTSAMPINNSGAYDSRDLNRDGYVSTSEKLASTHIGGHQSEEARLRLHEEQLAISKREVGAGEVGIHKRVQEQHVEQTIPVRREEVVVERRPLSGIADANARIAPQDETMRVALFREELVTEKRVVPTEEVIVRKQEVVDQQTVGATLRSEHIETVQTNTQQGSSMIGGVHDARDTNYDGHVSMGEKLRSGSALGGTSSSGFHDARDTNFDGHVSTGEKLRSGSALGGTSSTGLHDARDTNFDGRVSAGEKLKGAALGTSSKGAYDSRDLNGDGHVSTGEKIKGAARG